MTQKGIELKHKRIALKSTINELSDYDISDYESQISILICAELILNIINFLKDLDVYYYKSFIEEVKKSLKQNEMECKDNARKTK